MSIPEKTDSSAQGLAKASKKRQFTINLAKYPSDLGSKENPHYLEIQINVRGKSKFNKGNRVFRVDGMVDGASLGDEELARASRLSASAGMGMVGYGITNKIFKTMTKTGGFFGNNKVSKEINNALGAAAGGIAGSAAGAITYNTVSTSDLLKPDSKHRISDVVHLYLAEPPEVKYKTQWANKDLGTLAGILSGSAFNDGVGAGLAESGIAMGAVMAKLPSVFGAIDVRDVLSASGKTSLNPFKECIFESVDFRSYTFTYRFMPRSEKESLEVDGILRLLKFHMHPEMSDGKLFFIYPSEFQLTYYYKGRENESLHKFAPCVLTNLEISYGDEVVSSFGNGHFTEIMAKMTFHETEIVTKESIDKGY